MTNNTQTCITWGMTRASTLKQSESPATQREIILAAAKSLGLPEPTILDEPLATSGRSKKFAQRPMGLFLLRTLRSGHTLIVTKVDRLGRNLRDIYDTVDTFYQRKVNVIILHGFGGKVIDMRNATDRIFLLLLAWFAEYEGERISERTKEGLTHRRNSGLSYGRQRFTYIQAYSADGKEIPIGEYNRTKGCFKRNLPDHQWLCQLLELLRLQKATRAKGKVLFEYCREKEFVNRAGKKWWHGTLHFSPTGTFMGEISKAIRMVRRLAVLGQLPEDYNERVLAITGDTPAKVQPVKRGPRAKPGMMQAEIPSDADMENWDADRLREWIRQSKAGGE